METHYIECNTVKFVVSFATELTMKQVELHPVAVHNFNPKSWNKDRVFNIQYGVLKFPIVGVEKLNVFLKGCRYMEFSNN